MGIMIRYGGANYDLDSISPPEVSYNGAVPFGTGIMDYGTARLKFRINSGNNYTVKGYGLTTNTSASQYCKLRLYVSGKPAWLGKSSTGQSVSYATGSEKTTREYNSTYTISRINLTNSKFSTSNKTESYVTEYYSNYTTYKSASNGTLTTATSMKSYLYQFATATIVNGFWWTAPIGQTICSSSFYADTKYSNDYNAYTESRIKTSGNYVSTVTIISTTSNAAPTSANICKSFTSIKSNTSSATASDAFNSLYSYSCGTVGYYSSQTSKTWQRGSSFSFKSFESFIRKHTGSFFLVTVASGNFISSAGFAARTAKIAAAGGARFGEGIVYLSHTKSSTFETSANYGHNYEFISSTASWGYSAKYSNTSQVNSVYTSHIGYTYTYVADEINYIPVNVDNSNSAAHTSSTTNVSDYKYGLSFITSHSGAKRWYVTGMVGTQYVNNYSNSLSYYSISTGSTKTKYGSVAAGKTVSSFASSRTLRRWRVHSNYHYVSWYRCLTSGGTVTDESVGYNFTWSGTVTLTRGFSSTSMYGSFTSRASITWYSKTTSLYSRVYTEYYSSTTHNFNI